MARSRRLALIKIGGSIATSIDAHQTGFVATPNLVRIARQMNAWEGDVVFVHGTGWIGKPAAIEHGFESTGRLEREQRMIALKIKRDLIEMTARVAGALLDEGLPIVALDIEEHRSADGSSRLSHSLDRHLADQLVPLFRGDMIATGDGDYRVLSSDEIMSLLARELRPELAIFLTDVDGVFGWDSQGKGDETLLRELRVTDQNSVASRDSDALDVSDGMSGKIKHALATALHANRCCILNGTTHGRLADLLSGGDPIRTEVLHDGE